MRSARSSSATNITFPIVGKPARRPAVRPGKEFSIASPSRPVPQLLFGEQVDGRVRLAGWYGQPRDPPGSSAARDSVFGVG